MKIGDRVLINRTDIFHLKHRMDKPIYGIIEHIDAEYVIVKPMWCKWSIELYKSEITLV